MTIVFFIFLFFMLLQLEIDSGEFTTFFTHFGPGTNSGNTAYFIGIPIDSWGRVISLYVLSFFTTFFIYYYEDVSAKVKKESFSDPKGF